MRSSAAAAVSPPGAVQELCEFAELKVLYLHGNNITKLHEVEKLSKLGLRTLTERIVSFARRGHTVSIQIKSPTLPMTLCSATVWFGSAVRCSSGQCSASATGRALIGTCTPVAEFERRSEHRFRALPLHGNPIENVPNYRLCDSRHSFFMSRR